MILSFKNGYLIGLARKGFSTKKEPVVELLQAMIQLKRANGKIFSWTSVAPVSCVSLCYTDACAEINKNLDRLEMLKSRPETHPWIRIHVFFGGEYLLAIHEWPIFDDKCRQIYQVPWIQWKNNSIMDLWSDDFGTINGEVFFWFSSFNICHFALYGMNSR